MTKDFLNLGGTQLPVDYVTQKAAIMGVTGTGKSVGGGDIMEEMAKKDIPFICLDVLGVHRGIGETFDNVELVRVHEYADWDECLVHLTKLINDPTQSIMIDLLEWNDDQMQETMAVFLNNLFEVHRGFRTPRHVFIEEAEVFAPQTGYENSKVSLTALNRIMKRGRSVGLGCTLISQRPQDVNKKTLSQSQCTFLLHLEGVLELKVVNEMLKSSKDRKALVEKVEKFKQGECLIYSPQWLGKHVVFKFRDKETKHYGETPTLNSLKDYTNKKTKVKQEETEPSFINKLTNTILDGMTLGRT